MFYNGFLSIRKSDHVVVSFSIDFFSNSQRDAPFHCIAYDYSRADWDGLCDHLRDVPWDDVFKLGACAAASEFCDWFQTGIDVYISHRKYQIKPHSSPWFLAAGAAAIVHRDHFFVCPKRINLLILKKCSYWLVIVAKEFSKLPNSGISLLVFRSRVNLKQCNTSVTPNMVKEVLMNLDLSKTSGPDCIPVVVLKNCEPKRSYILAELFNKCL